MTALALPPHIDALVYGLVETVLTAGDTGPARIHVRREPTALDITVTGVPRATARPTAEQLRERAALAGGRVDVEGGGTLRLRLPAAPAPASDFDGDRDRGLASGSSFVQGS